MELFNLTYDKVFTKDFAESLVSGAAFLVFMSWLLSGCSAVAIVL